MSLTIESKLQTKYVIVHLGSTYYKLRSAIKDINFSVSPYLR